MVSGCRYSLIYKRRLLFPAYLSVAWGINTLISIPTSNYYSNMASRTRNSYPPWNLNTSHQKKLYAENDEISFFGVKRAYFQGLFCPVLGHFLTKSAFFPPKKKRQNFRRGWLPNWGIHGRPDTMWMTSTHPRHLQGSSDCSPFNSATSFPLAARSFFLSWTRKTMGKKKQDLKEEQRKQKGWKSRGTYIVEGISNKEMEWITSWWLNQSIEKICERQIGSSPPGIRQWKFQQKLKPQPR